MNAQRCAGHVASVICVSLFAALIFGLVPATHASTTVTVTSTLDAVDINPGDGLCATAASECTLRAAIQETNALGGDDLIIVPAGTYLLTRIGAGENAAATGDLDVTDHLTIQGSGPHVTIIDGGRQDRVLHLPTPSQVSISGLTVQNGQPPNPPVSGGGIFNGLENQPGGSLRLTNVTVTKSSATYGGGIMNGWGATASLLGVTVSYNSADAGGGIYTRDSGPVSLINSTVSYNSATHQAGGIDTWFHAKMSLTNVTVSHNSAPVGGGIFRESTSDEVFLAASIIANNNSGDDCEGLVISTGNNLDSDTTCSLTQPSDLPNAEPRLGPLQDNGGPTFTHALLPGSPAIDHIPPEKCAVTADQRYVARPQDGNGDGIARCDSGAYEVAPAVMTVSVDIKPGSATNTINPKSNGVIPVAILTTTRFDATIVDPLRVIFGPNGARETHGRGHHDDVDGDGDVDVVLHFRIQETGLQCGMTSATLNGTTRGGQALTGADDITTMGCRNQRSE